MGDRASSTSSLTPVPTPVRGSSEEDGLLPSAEEILESTTNYARPLPTLERIRSTSRLSDSTSGKHSRQTRGSDLQIMDLAVMTQIDRQLDAATDLDMFLKVVVGVVKDLTQFHRVAISRFDEEWNGQTVAELLDWHQTHDLYKGLWFPSSDIPVQVRRPFFT